jgi:tellurite resistance protein
MQGIQNTIPTASGTVPGQTTKVQNPIQYLPVGLFGATVALSGLGIAWKQSTALFGAPPVIANAVTLLTWIAFLCLIVGYATKMIRFPEKVKAELNNPVVANFLGTFFISAVLLASLTVPISLTIARFVWTIGAIGGLIFMFILTSRLYRGDLKITDAVPPTLIPGLTVLNTATAGAAMKWGWFTHEFDLILFSLGIVYVFVFFVLISYRLIHREPVITFLVPTLLLMCAPFEVGFITYTSQVPQVDMFASVIFYFGLFIFVVLFFFVFKKGLPFMVSWWGSCFSAGALANAAIKYANVSHDPLVECIAIFLLIVLTVMVIITFTLTISHLLKGKLLKP